MALIIKDRVKEQTTTTGTGTVTLGGTVSGFDTFASVGDGNTTYYAIVHQSADEWEVGLGTYTAAGTTLSRDTVLESSNADAAVNFSAGTKDVFVTYPADKAVYINASDVVDLSSVDITAAAGTFTTLTGTTVAGGMIASQAEQEAGTATDHVVVPGRQQFHPSAAKAWGCVTYSSGTPTLQASYNVSGISDLDVGRLSVSWDTDFSSTNYSVVAFVEAAGGATALVAFTESGAQAAGSVILRIANLSGSAADPARINFVAFGDQ